MKLAIALAMMLSFTSTAAVAAESAECEIAIKKIDVLNQELQLQMATYNEYEKQLAANIEARNFRCAQQYADEMEFVLDQSGPTIMQMYVTAENLTCATFDMASVAPVLQTVVENIEAQRQAYAGIRLALIGLAADDTILTNKKCENK